MIGRSLECLIGNVLYSDFDSLLYTTPSSTYDSLLMSYTLATGTTFDSVVSTLWTDRVFSSSNYSTNSTGKSECSPLSTKKRYKPVHRKFRPVPTYMPNPEAQEFLPIPPPSPTLLPTHPPPIHSLSFGNRVTKDRLFEMMLKIEPGLLTEAETNLIAFVIVSREQVFAFDYAEKGMFSRNYYPDYEIPTIEHTPWQRKPIFMPQAIIDEVKKIIREQEEAGRFKPMTSSYRSSMFAVAKKSGIRLVINLEELNVVTIQDSALPPNVNEFAESFLGHSIYGLLDLFSGFDARWVAPHSRPLQAFHTPLGARQQTTLVQGYTNSVQEFQRCVRPGLNTHSNQFRIMLIILLTIVELKVLDRGTTTNLYPLIYRFDVLSGSMLKILT